LSEQHGKIGCVLNSAKTLLELQATDQKLAEKQRHYTQIVTTLEKRGGLEQLREQSETARITLLEAKLEVGRIESDVATLNERVSVLEKRLYSGTITSVRELTAVETEHSSAKRSLAQAQESLEPAQSEQLEAESVYENGKDSLQKQEIIWLAEEQDLAVKRDVLIGECNVFGAERLAATKNIPPSDLAHYESLLARKAGVAVARVARGVCQGCRVRLPLSEQSKLRTSDNLISCGTCGRILTAE
jgi:hypothetical protein